MASVLAIAGHSIFSSVPLDGVFRSFLLLRVYRGSQWPSRVDAMSNQPMFTHVTNTTCRRGDFSGCGALPIEFLPLSIVLPRGSANSDYQG